VQTSCSARRRSTRRSAKIWTSRSPSWPASRRHRRHRDVTALYGARPTARRFTHSLKSLTRAPAAAVNQLSRYHASSFDPTILFSPSSLFAIVVTNVPTTRVLSLRNCKFTPVSTYILFSIRTDGTSSNDYHRTMAFALGCSFFALHGLSHILFTECGRRLCILSLLKSDGKTVTTKATNGRPHQSSANLTTG